MSLIDVHSCPMIEMNETEGAVSLCEMLKTNTSIETLTLKGLTFMPQFLNENT